MGEDFLSEIVCRGQEIFEDSIAVACLHLILGMVQRKAPDVFGFCPVCLDPYCLGRVVFVYDYAETVVEISLSVCLSPSILSRE